ncbi:MULTISPECIES: relaxase/mobilization nuclease domain-containing protein [Devosia]|uniref:relaxase/mobilization nuclease domain-containing protein n=1 Tax=Devosia TaxID=46913 RepID=UPI000CE975A6|nr:MULTISPECIES: relaxase/mobilization nuclease domain-containing protein [Devosia]AVF03754.1 hypothetical protein C4375_08470 [Devosia sp. I507]
MIGKIKNLPAGDDLARLANYLQGPKGKRIAAFRSMNLATSDPSGVVHLMDAQAGLSRRAKKPIAHITVSYAPTDRVNFAKMEEDAQRVLAALSAEGAQAFMVVHNDKHYPHFHLVVNRVGIEGRCISDANTKRKIEKTLRRIEYERGLRPVSGRLADVPNPTSPGIRFKSARAARRGYVLPPSEVVQAMREARSRRELDVRLGELGWRLESAKPKPGQKTGGLVLRGPEGALARASDCGRDCSGPALVRRFSGTVAIESPLTTEFQVTAPQSPKPTGRNALAKALAKARAKPRLPRIAPQISTTGTIARVVRTTMPNVNVKF